MRKLAIFCAVIAFNNLTTIVYAQEDAKKYDLKIRAISCGDAMAVGTEARTVLHKAAQKRAQKAVEEFIGKPLTLPYIQLLDPKAGNPTSTASIVEVYWCETENTPLNKAYYNLYTSSKKYFDKKYLRK